MLRRVAEMRGASWQGWLMRLYLLKCFETLHELKTDDDNVELVMT